MTDAIRQRAHRARRAAKLERLTALAEAVVTELADSTGAKGKRLHAMAVEALA